MSGGGGSGDPPPVGPRPTVDCAALTFDTTLASPDAAVVATLNVGDALFIDVVQAPGGRNVIAGITSGGQTAGAITDRTTDLLHCIQEGFAYVAEVTAIQGGWVDLSVRPA